MGIEVKLQSKIVSLSPMWPLDQYVKWDYVHEGACAYMYVCISEWECTGRVIYLPILIAQSAAAVEYTDSTSAEG